MVTVTMMRRMGLTSGVSSVLGTVLVLAVSVLAGCDKEEGKGAGVAKATTPAVARGQQLVEEKGCLSCHSTDGRRGAGPTWLGLSGSTVRLADGATVVADAEYLRRSILDPNVQIVQGFPPGLMASVVRPGTVSADEADAIVAYLESLASRTH